MADSEEYYGLIPDSELDPPEGVSAVPYFIQDGGTVEILPNDWVDLDTSIPLDPLWGSSFQVLQCLEEYITVKMLDWSDLTYKEVAVSPGLIINNYRRVTKVFI